MSPTQRSLKMLRAEGFTVAVTEHWNAFAHIRQDLFGFVDLVALRASETLAVQTTTADNLSARRRKILASPLLSRVLGAGWRIEIHGWRKVKGRWAARREAIGTGSETTLGDTCETENSPASHSINLANGD
jgi:hypothetical protein